MPMKIAFRVDSSPQIGSGHFRRCLVLADEAQLLGFETLFVSAFLSATEQAALAKNGHNFALLDVLPNTAWSTARNPDWNSLVAISDELRDADGTSLILRKYSADFVVLDHYFLTQRWVDLVRRFRVRGILAIEDLNRKWNDIEFVVNGNLNQSVSLHPESRAVELSGGKFAIISSEYRVLRNESLLPPSARQQVTIFVGGSDLKDFTSLLATAVLDVCRDDWPIEVVVGSFSEHLDAVRQLVAGSHQVTLSTNKPSMAETYSRTRLALGAGGTSAWERACLGVPTVLSSIAPNQISVCESLSQVGGAIYLGSADDVTRQQVSSVVEALISSPALLDQYSQAGLLAIDGYGAKRVMQTLDIDFPDKLFLRRAVSSDCEILFTWFNDPSTRINSLNSKPVSWLDHKRWFYTQLASEDVNQFMLDSYGLPIGQIRFDNKGETLLLSYSIDHDFRRRGYGRVIVELGVEAARMWRFCPIKAIVKKNNLASIRIFESLGFAKRESEISDSFEFVLS